MSLKMVEWYECPVCDTLVQFEKKCRCQETRWKSKNGRLLKTRVSQGEKRRRILQKRDGPGCQACGTHEELTIDHKLPLSRGGGGGMSNTWVLCKPCNNEKGDRTVAEWRPDLG